MNKQNLRTGLIIFLFILIPVLFLGMLSLSQNLKKNNAIFILNNTINKFLSDNNYKEIMSFYLKDSIGVESIVQKQIDFGSIKEKKYLIKDKRGVINSGQLLGIDYELVHIDNKNYFKFNNDYVTKTLGQNIPVGKWFESSEYKLPKIEELKESQQKETLSNLLGNYMNENKEIKLDNLIEYNDEKYVYSISNDTEFKKLIGKLFNPSLNFNNESTVIFYLKEGKLNLIEITSGNSFLKYSILGTNEQEIVKPL